MSFTNHSSVGSHKKIKDLDLKEGYWERFLVPMMFRWRLFWLALSFFLIAFLEGITLIILLPLKRTEPYVLEVERSTGRVEINTKALGHFHPSQANVAYFLKLWAKWVFSIEGNELMDNLPRASSWLKGESIQQLNQWIQHEKPAEMIAHSGLFRRSIIFHAVNWGKSEKRSFIDMTLIDTNNGIEQKRNRFLLTVEFYVPDQPSTIDEDNPLGIKILHFSLSSFKNV